MFCVWVHSILSSNSHCAAALDHRNRKRMPNGVKSVFYRSTFWNLTHCVDIISLSKERDHEMPAEKFDPRPGNSKLFADLQKTDDTSRK